MASYAEEKMIRAHVELIEEGGEYAGYFTQGESGMWVLADVANQATAQALLDAKVAVLDNIGPESSNGEGPSDFGGYTPIHFDNTVDGVQYRTWFVKDGSYYVADDGNSDTLTEVTDEDEIATLLADSGFIPN